jgi:23S rRNA pseudouridine1911/1915/1917 synthase
MPTHGRDAQPSSENQADDQDTLIAPGGKVDQQALFELYEKSEQATGDDEAPVTVRFQLLRDLDKRLDKYLVDRIPFLSRTSLQELIREKAVTVNGRPAKASTKLHKRDVVEAVLPPPLSTEIPAENIPLDVLYEDDHLIVINKRANIIVHPARGNKTGTIINALAWHFQHTSSGALSTIGDEFARPGVVHRLDRHTTGVMVAAKTDTAHWRLGKQFERRQTEKRYLAVVHGQMEPFADVIDLPMGKHPTIREKYSVRWDETGKPSVTIYRVREVYKDFTLVELELKTGRTHQIRVHLSHLGYPIVGDDIYGGKHLRVGNVAPRQSPGIAMPGLSPELSWNQPLITRYALHAAMLGFTHPITNERMTLQAPVHDDMRLLIQLLRQHRFIAAPKVAGTVLDLDQMIKT